MIIRKLEQSEHIATRKLWEEIFPEDTKAFLDYYYYIKAAKNQIYVVEEDGRICSMLQLNPYRIRLEDKSFPSEYIVAVATKKEYRSRGYMRALLNTVLERMHSEKVPFTFLMPAAEAIYRPYDFRYIYDQCMQEVKKDETADDRNRESEPQKEGTLEFSDAGLWDAEEMADFFEEHFSDSWQVYAQRDTAYYQTMILEQQSEKGGVRLMRENGVSSFGCSYKTADIEFEYTLSQARQKGNNLAFHLIQSFEPGEVDCEKAHAIGKQLADAVTKGQHEYVLTTHIDKGHIHNHIIFCAVNFVDYHKYNSNKRSYYGIRNMSDKLCRENGLSVVVPGKGSKGKSYVEYQAEKTGTSWKGKLKIAVDTLIPQVASFEELLQRLQAAGYEIKPGKYISCRAPGQERFTRLKTLGADYTEEAIKERIAGKRTKAAKAPKEQRGVSLLIDIENSIKAQESRGYEQWAKIHNLKLAAKTMNFLTEHQIEQYADLVSRIEEISAENEKTADTLKSVEKRLADMAVLMKHVTTYQKTKPVYEAYRRAKDKDAYRAKQESGLILHEAAVKTLKAVGVTKLPNLAAMQEEYGKLQAQKEALYADYGRLKKQVKEYDVIKQNIDSILRQDKELEREKGKERE